MFAVIQTGGKQYKVAKNDVIKVEKLAGDAGATIVLDEVLLVNDGKKTTVGSPLVKDIKVSAEVLEQKKDDKVIIFKKKRRHNYRRKNGHRQEISVLRIQDIGAGLTAKAPAKAAAKKAAPKKAEEKKEAAPKAKAESKKPAAKKAPAKKAAAKKEDK